MEKQIPPEIIQNIVEIIYYGFGLLTTWLIKLIGRKKENPKRIS